MPASNRRPLYSEGDLAAGEGGGGGAGGGGGSGGAAASGDAAAGAAAAGRVALPAAAGAGALSLSPGGATASAGSGAAEDALPSLFPKQPCTIKGLAAALSAGVLGYLFGFIPGMIRHHAKKWALIHLDGMRSAQSLAVMSGAYTAVHCICQRIRQTEDGWNRGVAGCATGLALGWGNGPLGAATSCVSIGGLSYLIDFGGGAADAAPLEPRQQEQQEQQQQQQRGGGGGAASSSGGGGGSGRNSGAPRARGGEAATASSSSGSGAATADPGPLAAQRRELERAVRDVLALPPVAFLGEAFRSAYFEGCGGGGSGGPGCRAWPPAPRPGDAAGAVAEQRRR
jgi:import inner membrane translocase subunit TIM22